MEAPNLARDVPIYEAHEAGELRRIVDGQQEMDVIAHHDESMNLHREGLLGTSYDAEDEIIEASRRSK